MLAFLFTSYGLFVVSRLMPQAAADNLVIIHFERTKRAMLFMHAKLVYYVYIRKSRDFAEIYQTFTIRYPTPICVWIYWGESPLLSSFFLRVAINTRRDATSFSQLLPQTF